VVRDKFDDYSHNYVAINNQGEIEGCIRVNPDGPEGLMLETCHSLNGLREGRRLAEFNRFVVSQRYYGKHLGPLLMKAGYQCAVQHGITHIVLSTRLELQGFYQKLGFIQVGEKYSDPRYPYPFDVTMVLDRLAAQNEWPCSRPRLYDFFTSSDNRIAHGKAVST
jgi:predicted GNAT family N-acyltransferase